MKINIKLKHTSFLFRQEKCPAGLMLSCANVSRGEFFPFYNTLVWMAEIKQGYPKLRSYVEKCAPKYYFFFFDIGCDLAGAHDHEVFFLHVCVAARAPVLCLKSHSNYASSGVKEHAIHCAVNIPTAFLVGMWMFWMLFCHKQIGLSIAKKCWFKS